VCEIIPHLGFQCSVKTFNDTGFVLLVLSGKEVGEDFKRCASCHFQIGAASDAFTDIQRNCIYQPSISNVSQRTRHALFTTYNEETKASIVESFRPDLKMT
jgi:hypothetical protein